LARNKFTNAIQQVDDIPDLVPLRRSVIRRRSNVIPSVAEAGLDCRVLPGTTKDQWIAEVKRRLGDPGITIELINESDDPVVTSQDSPPLTATSRTPSSGRHPEAIVTPMLIPVRHRLERLPPKRGQELRLLSPALLSADVVAGMHGDAEHNQPRQRARRSPGLLRRAARQRFAMK